METTAATHGEAETDRIPIMPGYSDNLTLLRAYHLLQHETTLVATLLDSRLSPVAPSLPACLLRGPLPYLCAAS